MPLEEKFKLSMDVEGLRARYASERAKRLRPEGNGQYRPLDRDPDGLDTDPYVDEHIVREPIVADHEVVIVGGGFGGLLQGAHLRKKGFQDIVVVEKGGDFGGTWYWNRYPGAACDVESYIYLPLLDETAYVPVEKYSKAPEIHDYCKLLGRSFDLYKDALFQTQVVGAVWNDKTNRWAVTTDRGDTLNARFLIIAGGILHKAKLPDIEGAQEFKGHTFHTSRWDYEYTGGSPLEFMQNLGDKRVGIVGTGATSVQVIPRLAEAAGQLFVFQRTPSSISVRGNANTDPNWVESLRPGWQKERLDNWIAIMSGRKPDIDMVQDGWTHIFTQDGLDRASGPEEHELASELADFERMDALRARVDEVVRDPKTAEALKPWYGQMCKRPCFHDEYLEAFNRPNVTLVDTHGRGVEKLSSNGVLVNGEEFPLDLLIYASGFEVTTEFTQRMGFDPVGPGGLSLKHAWSEGAETLHGTFVRHFPNMFVISTIQGGQMSNFVHMIHEAAIHIAHALGWAAEHGAVTIEPKMEATEAWKNTIFGTLMTVAKYTMSCTPGYINNEGQLGDMSAARRAPYMGKPDEFLKFLREWRTSHGEERDLIITTVEDAS